MLHPCKCFSSAVVAALSLGMVSQGARFERPGRPKGVAKPTSNRKQQLLDKALRRQARAPRC